MLNHARTTRGLNLSVSKTAGIVRRLTPRADTWLTGAKIEAQGGEKTWALVFSFLRHSFAARVPADSDPSKGPGKLHALNPDSGHLGQNWNATPGGYQTLPTAPIATFSADKSTASWLLNATFAGDWQSLQRDGQVGR